MFRLTRTNTEAKVGSDDRILVARVARNAGYLVIADVANKLLAFLFFALTARHVGAVQFGELSLAIALVTVLSVIADLGLGAFSAREIARDRAFAGRQVGNVMLIKLLAVAVLVAGMLMVVSQLGYSHSQLRVIVVASLAVLPVSLVLYLGSVFQGFERMEFTALSKMAQSGLLVGGCLLIRQSRASAVGYAWLYVVAAFAAMLIAVAVLRFVLSVGFGITEGLSHWIGLVRQALPFGISALFVVVYYWNGTAILSKTAGEAEVGLYSAAFRLVLGVSLLPFALAGAMYPALARLHAGDAADLGSKMTTSVEYVLMFSAPVAAFGLAVAGPVVSFVYGGGYGKSADALAVLSLWGGFASLNSILSNYLYAVGRARDVVAQAAVSLVVCVCLGLLLTGKYGSIGAAISITAAEMVGTAWLYLSQRRLAARLEIPRLIQRSAKFTGAAVLAAALAWLLARYSHVLLSLSAGVVAYVLLLLMVKGLDGSDLNRMRRVFGGGG